MFSTRKTLAEKQVLLKKENSIPHLLDRINSLEIHKEENIIHFGKLDRELWAQARHNYFEKVERVIEDLHLNQFHAGFFKSGVKGLKWYLIYKEYEYLENTIFEIGADGRLESRYQLLPYNIKLRRILLKNRMGQVFKEQLEFMKKMEFGEEFTGVFFDIMERQTLLHYK